MLQLHYSQSLLCDEKFNFQQTPSITPETALKDSLDEYRQEIVKDDLKQAPRAKWDQLARKPRKEKFSNICG